MVSTYQCYKCDSAQQKDCDDPFNSKTLANRKIYARSDGACIVGFISNIFWFDGNDC
jgi:hypothetical protein